MLRTFARMTPAFMPLFGSRHPYDKDYVNSPRSKEPETGWERVKAMYTMNEYDEVSVELHSVVQSTLCGTFIGAGLGGFVKSRESYLYFIENNQATIFKSPMNAKKRLQDYVTVAFAKGAVRWGWRLGIFTALFNATATTVSAYRGDTSLSDFIAAGAIAGGLYKANLGLAATFVGAGLGAALSTVAGLAILGILKVTGTSMDEIRKALHKIKEARAQQLQEAMGKASDNGDKLLKHHDLVVAEKGAKKIEDF